MLQAWLNLGFLLGDGDRGFIESIVTAARYNRNQQETAKTEAAKRQKQKGNKTKASTTSVADVDDDLERNDLDEEEGGVGGGSSAAASTDNEDSSAEDRLSEAKRVMLHELDEHLEVGLSFSDSASLLLQLAYILQKSRRWAHQSQLRVNFVYSNTSGEFENDVLVRFCVRGYC